MLSRRKPLALLAAVIAALAAAVPAASASAATTRVDPTVCQLLDISESPFGPGMFLGGASLVNTLSSVGAQAGCPAPTPQQLLFPFGSQSPFGSASWFPSASSWFPLGQQSVVPAP